MGDREDRDRPAKTAFSNCAAVALGEDHAVAVDADGAVWAWGASRAGRLARDDAPDGSSVPLRVDIADVSRVAAGGAALDFPARATLRREDALPPGRDPSNLDLTAQFAGSDLVRAVVVAVDDAARYHVSIAAEGMGLLVAEASS